VKIEEEKDINMEIKKSTVITARHKTDGAMRTYLVTKERMEDGDYFRVLNINTNMIMSGFKTKDANEIVSYIEGLGKGHEIIKIIN
jgi:hypothetical protein